jgi:UDP-N-acetylmuramate dehydrogenase
VRLRDRSDLAAVLRACGEHGTPLTALGAGSNALILDGGVRGVVVRVDDRRMELRDDGLVELAAGCMLPRAALDLARRGLSGLEFGIGVPGTCGASVYGNAGAFGTEVRDVLVSCTVITPAGAQLVLRKEELGFAYRHSRLKDDLRGHVVASAIFRVRGDDPAAVRARTRAVQAQRKLTQPIGLRSLGSVFKNPAGENAGRLIEACGLKGARSGGAEISAKHANFIVNAGAATAEDVLSLIRLAHDTVLERFGVELEREVIVLGDPRGAALSSR